MSNPDTEYFVIGIIIGAHGVGGAVRVLPTTDNPDRFRALTRCFLKEKSAPLIQSEIKCKSIGPKELIVEFDSIKDRDDASALKGTEILVERSAAITLPPDRWFVVDLIGCGVFDDVHGHIGNIAEVISRSGQDVWVIKAKDLADVLVPYTKEFVTSVDIADKVVKTALPQGLVELYRSAE